MFHTNIENIIDRVNNIDPIKYAKTRNFIDGAVTYLSPYISRGVISTKQVMESLYKRGFKTYQMEKFLQELAWRDYFQQVAKHKLQNELVDIKQFQPDVKHYSIPKAVVDASTSIQGIDLAIQQLYHTGYMHNHVRMYVASIVCNVAKSYWKLPAQWMYYYLLDADFASNTCSWQWVAASFSSKKYYANQDNINKYCQTNQTNTFLHLDYSELNETLPIPAALQETISLNFTCNLPATDEDFKIDSSKPTLLYNFYNLDPLWHKDEDANRVLLFEPEHFQQFPVSDKTIEFVLKLAKNIPHIQVYHGSYKSFVDEHQPATIYYKEHPLFKYANGIEESRDWMFPEVKGYYNSFFAFWKKASNYLP